MGGGLVSRSVQHGQRGGVQRAGPLEAAPPGGPTAAAGRTAAGTGDGPWTNGNLGLSLNSAETELTVTRAGATIATISMAYDAAPLRKPAATGTAPVNTTNVTVVTAGTDFSYFGFGEHENGKLDQLGLEYDMETCIEYSKSKGGEVCLPWVLVSSDLGKGKEVQFGMLWNVPAYGSVAFGTEQPASHSWTGFNIDQADLFITTSAAGSTGMQANADILSHYVDAVGHAPALPDWAAGYWHSKNRYTKQQEVLDTMATFETYKIPVAVFVIDYFNWAVMGNLTFNPANWPNPKSMVDTLKGYGTKIMVSTWPFSQGSSKTYEPLQQQGFAVYNGTNSSDSIDWPDGVCGHPCYLYDASNPEARKFWWGEVKKGYYDYGIEIFWLDAAEPENMGGSPPGSTWSVGSMERVGMMYPYYHTQTYFEGMTADGSTDFMMLSRSAWAGMSKHHAALWNGDTHSQYKYLKTAVQAGQNVQLSGIAWWTTDIGGYSSPRGVEKDPVFRELIVRWFQFGVTCPLFRQHGARNTEPWLLGNTTFGYVREVMAMREAFKPYILAELAETAKSGLPLNRPLWFDTPADKQAWKVDDQFSFGRDYMVAPIYTQGATGRDVYFPAGTTWVHHFTNKAYHGGTTAHVDGPINQFPLFKRGPNMLHVTAA